MKKILSLLLIAAMIFTLAACGNGNKETGTGGKTDAGTGTPGSQTAAKGYDDIPDTMTSQDGRYAIAFVTDVGQLKDNSFNQFTWNGVKSYASENKLSYKYYQPANGDQATDDDRYDAMASAVNGGAAVIVAAGFLQAGALTKAATAFPDTKFVFVDGWTLEDENKNPLKNVASVVYREEQAGFFAGYAVVMEGLTKLGFSGGGGGTNPACIRYGYGFVQGAEAAAKEKGAKIEMKYSWEFGANFGPSQDLQAMLNGWYQAGTECVFVCGGSMCQSAFAAASANDALVVGVDVDQSGLSDSVITSAMKDLAGSVKQMLGKFYASQWDLIGGSTITLGATENAVGIPTATWKLQNWKVDDYNKLFENVKTGTVQVDDKEVSDPSTVKWENITFVK